MREPPPLLIGFSPSKSEARLSAREAPFRYVVELALCLHEQEPWLSRWKVALAFQPCRGFHFPLPSIFNTHSAQLGSQFRRQSILLMISLHG